VGLLVGVIVGVAENDTETVVVLDFSVEGVTDGVKLPPECVLVTDGASDILTLGVPLEDDSVVVALSSFVNDADTVIVLLLLMLAVRLGVRVAEDVSE